MKTQLSKPSRTKRRYSRTRFNSSLDYQGPTTFESKLNEITLNYCPRKQGKPNLTPILPSSRYAKFTRLGRLTECTANDKRRE